MNVRDLPWSDIGMNNMEQKNIDEVLSNSKLDYEMQLSKVYDKEGNEMKGFEAITRSDKKGIAYGYVKNRYVPPQNKTDFAFFDRYIKMIGASYGYAGELWDGELVWMFAKTNDCIQIANSEICIYALFTIHQDARHGKRVTFIPIRDVCNNVLIANMTTIDNFVSIPNINTLTAEHEYHENIEEARMKYVAALTKEYKLMLNRKVTAAEEKQFFNRVVTGNLHETASNLSGTFTNKIAGMTDFYKNHPSQQNITGTAFGLYNAVAGYYMNMKDYRGNKEKRFGNTFIGGDSYRSTEDAFRLASRLLSATS